MQPNWKKKRSKLGQWLDDHSLSQTWLVQQTGIHRSSITELCNGKVVNPQTETRQKIIKALSQVDPNVSAQEFW